MRKSIYFLTILLVSFVSCNRLVESKTQRKGEPDVFNVDPSNKKMSLAIEKARGSLYIFDDAFKSKNPNYEFFAIKQKFNSSEGSEHIWVQNLMLKDGEYFGTIANEPVKRIGVKLGDTIWIDSEKISDWIYYENNFVRGGYTIRAIRNNLSESEKKAFDYENGLIFDD